MSRASTNQLPHAKPICFLDFTPTTRALYGKLKGNEQKLVAQRHRVETKVEVDVQFPRRFNLNKTIQNVQNLMKVLIKF